MGRVAEGKALSFVFGSLFSTFPLNLFWGCSLACDHEVWSQEGQSCAHGRKDSVGGILCLESKLSPHLKSGFSLELRQKGLLTTQLLKNSFY